ncbi:hypothetical protein QYE76_033083 [Lolium multiflorum]|uniref:Uncharacterized protein n=1 Tax=Lolium multiflorum TaxID=4521 RepID=A0AAD8VLS5_LOLMU|nr:hypothetical protein QYE76_033083 [Lolium multiflorum]
MATPLSSAPPPFVPVQLDPTKDSGKDAEGTSANPEKTSGAEQAEQKAEENAAKKSKARQRDSEAKGKWWPCTTTEMELKNLEAEGFLQPGSWWTVPNSLAPAPQDNEMVLTIALVERGFSLPPSDFFSEILKDVSDPVGERRLPPFKNCPASETPAWTQCPHLSESPQLTRAIRRICKLTEEGLTGKDLTLSWFTKRIQPLQHRDRLMFHYTGRDDPMRATKDNLSADAIDKRIRLLIKIPRELHVHVCNKDININGSGTALEALEEEAEKKRLKLIDTSNRAQPDIHQFFKPSGSSGSQPPKAPRVLKKKVKPSPASIPVTPEVEVPPKASSATKPDPKDVINIDDLPEDPAGHGDSGKGASLSAPPPEQPSATFAEPTAEQYEQKVQLIHASSTLQTDPQPTPSLQKLSLAQRYAEVSAMMDKVWGTANTEMQELTDLDNDLKVFFAKHKDVRQNAENSQKAIQQLETRLQASLGFEWNKESALKRTEAYDEARSSIDELFAACRGIAKTLSLKRAKTSVIDTMTKLMQQVLEFIKDWQESSAHGVASLVLATCKAHFPSLNFADIARDTPKGANMRAILAETRGFDQLFVRRVNHSFWYHKHDLPKGFSDVEDEEEGKPEYYAEGSGSSVELSEEGTDEDSDIGSGNGDGDGSAYEESEEEDSE